MSGQPLRLYLFGSPRLVLDGVIVNLGRRKSLALLAYLAVTGQPHDRAALTTLFWPESDRRPARAALRQCLSDLKNKLEPPLLHLDSQMVSLDADAPLWVDVAAFGQHLAAGQQPPDWTNLKEAIDLYQADFMANFVLPNAPEFDEWERWQAICLKQEVLLACAELVRRLFTKEQLAEAIVYARRWANLDPLNETAQAELLRLYLRDGQVSVATHHYDWFAEQMEGALGQRPSWDLAQLQQEVLSSNRGSEPEMLPSPSGGKASVCAHLPRILIPFMGRERDLAAVVERLKRPDCALLSLLGPGGMGKTLLATAVARHMATACGYTVYFVSLERVESRAGVLAAIAHTMGITYECEEALHTAVVNELRNHQQDDAPCLLVLDNFEQLTHEAELLTSLLQTAPTLKLLVTSRVRLKLLEEWPYLLHGFAYPTETNDPDALSYEAVDFLAQATQRHASHYKLTEADWPRLVRICQAVDGLPLALELAAGWMGQLNLSQIVEMIAQQPEQLTTAWGNTSDRHSSLDKACAQTWALLEPAEQQAAQWATLFLDGFTIEGAAAVGITEPLLATLLDKSLVYIQLEQVSDEPSQRYRMHDLIRRYVQSQIKAEDIGFTAAGKRYIRYHLSFLNKRDACLQDERQLVALQEIQTELVNIRTAWRQAVTRHEWEAIRLAVAPLHLFYQLKGLFYLGAKDFALAVTHRQNDEVETISLRLRWGVCQSYLEDLGQLAEAERNLQTCLDQLGGQDRETLLEKGLALKGLAHVAVRRQEWTTAQQFYDDSLTIFRTINAPLQIAQTLSGLGFVACSLGNYEQARRLDEESLALYQQLRNPLGMATTLNNVSHTAEMAGDYGQAELWLQKSLNISKIASAHRLTAVIFSNLAHIAHLQGAQSQVEVYLKESLTLREQYLLPGRHATRKALNSRVVPV